MNKKLFLISAIACCCSLSSCDMDLTPETNIATDESVRNVGDCEKYSNLFHAEWRGYIQGSIAATELVQSGQVVATSDYGNTYGAYYRWDFQITDGTVQSCWSSNYNYIANANLLIQKAALLLEDPQISDADKQQIKLYMGHAYFSRAMAYREL
ncbi:RagB/SusD family nutrient uptake outer membrane protein, partial [Phocaeicola coprophilus]